MAICKRCKKSGLSWYKVHGKWTLWDDDLIQAHNEVCPEINKPLPENPKTYYCKHGLKERCGHGCI